MLISEVIQRKRDGEELSPDVLTGFLEAYRSGEVAEYQMSAFLMAVFFRGLTARELVTLTRCIIDSGTRLDFRDGGPVAVDKHSTGGVGDKVSLILAPLLAEYGLRVPMISGRGLGHTGGTLDKLESIPGFSTDLDLEAFLAVLADVGCAMIGQTPEIAPLDGRLYALRDVTSTVESVPLIAASIVSKKVAEGIEGLVLDVKFGRGAFMVRYEDAVHLARSLVELAESEGMPATALLTAMDEPLGCTVGNAVEVREAIECLRGGGPADLREVTLSLCAEAAVGVGVAPDLGTARTELAALLDDGGALTRFARLIEAQGGDARVVDDPDLLPSAPVRREVRAESEGWVVQVDARELGLAAVTLGAGRQQLDDVVDPAVGFDGIRSVGDRVTRGDVLLTVHADTEDAAETAEARVRRAIEVAGERPRPPDPLVRDRITGTTENT